MSGVFSNQCNVWRTKHVLKKSTGQSSVISGAQKISLKSTGHLFGVGVTQILSKNGVV